MDITQWIVEISVNFKFLKALHIRGMAIGDKDLELLARSRGKDLRSLRIHKCELVSEDGLMYISRYCNELRTLCLEKNTVVSRGNGEWLRELALRNMVIETFHFGYPFDIYDIKDVTLLAKNCCNSLVSLKIGPCMLKEIREAFRQAVRLEDFSGAYTDEDEDYVGFEFPLSMRCLGIYGLPVTSLPFLLPYVNQLRGLKLQCVFDPEVCQCFLFKKCPSLEVLYTQDKCGDTGLQVIGQFCKKLRKFIHYGGVTDIGLTDLAQGCYNLKYLDVNLLDISNEVMECIGTHLKNLRDLRMDLIRGCMDVPLENGIRAMLTGCNKLERLDIHLFHGGLTDVVSKLLPLFFIIYVSGHCTVLPLTRPTVPAEVLAELKPYIILAEKLHTLAVQLADASGVKMTYTSSRATDAPHPISLCNGRQRKAIGDI
ncbi:hypothetical protein Tco_0347317 [Tanacetum coccineum]